MKIEIPVEQNNISQQDIKNTETIQKEQDTKVDIEIVDENETNQEMQDVLPELQDAPQESQQSSEEDVQQKQVDEKIKKQLSEINNQYLEILEKIQIHQRFLQEISEASEDDQVKMKDQLKNSKKSFQENEIKLEKLLLALDSLVGASEEIRPQKKSAVVEIQKTINLIEGSILVEVKNVERKIEETQKKNVPPQQEEQKQIPVEETPLPQEKSPKVDGVQEEPTVQSEDKNEMESDEEKSVPEQTSKKVEEEDDEDEQEDDESFPFPSKKEWQLLTFEPKFNIQQLPGKYLISSKIPGLRNEDIKIKTSDNVLNIEGVRYPTEQEKNLLIKKLFQSVRNPHFLKRLTRNQIISAILKIASDYNFGKFSVKYELPSNFDPSVDVNAVYNNGFLQVELPIRTKNNSPFSQYNNNNFYRREVPFYGQRNRRPNNFWDFF